MPALDSAPVLVTGGAGFLGSHVCQSLLRRGHRVLALDVDHDQGRLDAAPGLERVTGDLRDEALVRELVGASSRVFHLGAIAGVHHYLERTLDVLDVNLLGTRSVLLAAHAADVPVLIASSSEAYGKNPALLREDGDTWLGPTTNARWCYATTKVAGEHYAWALARQGLSVAAVRYFNVYGPTLDAPGEGRVLSQFLGRLQAGEPLPLVDGGRAVRCFLYIDDAIEATLALGLALRPGSPLVGRPFNVGNAEPVTMRQLAERVNRLSGHTQGTVDISGASFFGQGFEDIDHRVPDVDALAEAIGFRARVTLDDGLRRVLDHWGLLAAEPAPVIPAPIPVIRPVYDADAHLMAQFRRALDEGRVTNAGPHVTAFETEAAAWLGAPATLAVASGAAGLHVAALALRRGGKAILPSFTYIATLNAIELAGMEPIFCDVDPHTFTMCPDHLARLLDAHDDVGLVVPVCAYGVPPDLDAIIPLCVAHDASVLYDAAHAFGTEVAGVRHDPRPDATVYSLHATKILPSIEGGLLVASDPDLRARLAVLRTHGLTPDARDSQTGLNAKMDELSAATARHGLVRFDATLKRRRAYGQRLTAALSAAGFTTQVVPEAVTTNFQNLCALTPGPLDPALATFAAHGIGTRRYFDPPLHQLHRLAGAPPGDESLLHTTHVWSRLVCLPIHSRMDEATLQRLERAIHAAGHG